MEVMSKRLLALSPRVVVEQLINDIICDHTVEERGQWAVNSKNKLHVTLTADEMKVLVGFLLLVVHQTRPYKRNYCFKNEDSGLESDKAMFRNMYRRLKTIIFKTVIWPIKTNMVVVSKSSLS
jgi:hypothetical protein